MHGARRHRADREAKFDNPYGKGRPQEQTPHHEQDCAGAACRGEDKATSGESQAPLEPRDRDDVPQEELHDDIKELLQDALDHGDQQHLQQSGQQQEELGEADQQLQDQDDPG